MLSSSKSILGFQYLCLDIVYLLLDCLQLTGTRHPDAEVELSLGAPEDEGSEREVQDIATQKLRQGNVARSGQARRQT